jgi:hypothetical protein
LYIYRNLYPGFVENGSRYALGIIQHHSVVTSVSLVAKRFFVDISTEKLPSDLAERETIGLELFLQHMVRVKSYMWFLLLYASFGSMFVI